MTESASLLIGYDNTNGLDNTVLIVGQKGVGQAVTIINAFQGEEAEELYKKLTTKRTLILDRPLTIKNDLGIGIILPIRYDGNEPEHVAIIEVK